MKKKEYSTLWWVAITIVAIFGAVVIVETSQNSDQLYPLIGK